jgi:hypothetical protein
VSRRPRRDVTAPGNPTNLTISYNSATKEYNAVWKAPSNNGGSPIQCYKYYITDPRPNGTVYLFGTVTQTNVTFKNTTNLSTGIYRFIVQSYNGSYPSWPGDYEDFHVISSPKPNTVTAPGSPMEVAVYTQNNTKSGKWLPPSNNGGSPITKYSWSISDNSGNLIHSGDVNSSTTSVVLDLTNLVDNKLYIFSVKSYNGSYYSSPNSYPFYLNDELVMKTVTAPSAPTDLQISYNNNVPTADWKEPDNNGGAPITLYQYFVTDERGNVFFFDYVNTTSVVLRDELTLPSGTYNFTVYSFNGTSYSLESASAPFSIFSKRTSNAVTAPADPSQVLVGVEDVKGPDCNLLLTITKPSNNGGAPIVGYYYTVSYYNHQDQPPVLENVFVPYTGDVTTTPFTVEITTKEYLVTVTSFNGKYTSPGTSSGRRETFLVDPNTRKSLLVKTHH